MRPRPTSEEPLALRRATGVPPWLSLVGRVMLAFGLIGIALGVHWFDRDGLRDNVDGAIDFTDVLYFTMITITTVGYGDIVPVTQQARMFDTFVVTPVRLFVWLIFLGSAYDFLLRGVWQRWRMKVIQAKLDGHLIVVGYGAGGTEAVRELMARGTPCERIVVVDDRAAALEGAEQVGMAVLDGDATRDATLSAARIERAAAVMVAVGRDDTSILIVLTARRLAPGVRISVVIRSHDNEVLAHQAGANTVINPASFAGLLLAGATDSSHIADYMTDLAGAGGRVSLTEREVKPEEVGRPLAPLSTGLGVRIYRGECCYGFWEPEAQKLEAGDLIVEIVPGGEPRGRPR